MSGPEAQWRAALAQGRFLLQRAVSSGTVIFPPRLAEPGTGDEELDWFEASGLGTVHAVTVIHDKPPASPYNVVLVELDEHVRLMSRVEGLAPEAVTIGLRVRARVGAEDGAPLLLFEPA